MARLHTLPLLLLLALAVIPHFCQGSAADRECVLDDDLSNAEQDRCLKQGERFVNELLKVINGPSRRRKRFNYCQSFTPFKECFEPILSRCSGVHNHLLNHWKIIYEVLDCGCSGTQSCKTSLNCFMEQMKGRLGQQCDALYRFNTRQNTQDRCHFLYENVRCKEALVESACSPESGVFAFHVAKIANNAHIKRSGCVITRDRPYNGFRYTEKCPANLTATIETCEKEHLGEKLGFRTDFDLIPSTSRRHMREACSDYVKYKTCMNTLEADCNHGISKVYSYDGALRNYILKMDYICNKGKKGFNQHLRCYKSMLENNTLVQCNGIWRELEPTLRSVNAHSFYCLKTSNITVQLRNALTKLRKCYEGFFADSCEGGGNVVAEMMERAFEDPVYLRYRFQPDCELHAGPPYATGAPPTRAPPTTPKSTKRPQETHNKPQPQKPEKSTSPSHATSLTCSSLTSLSLVAFTMGLSVIVRSWR